MERRMIMKSFMKQVLVWSVLFGCIFSALVQAQEKEWITLQKDLSADLKRIPVTLTFTASESTFYYESNAQSVQSKDIPSKGKKDDYKQQLDFGVAVDGYQYIVQVREAGDLNIINNNSDRPCWVKILRQTENSKPTVVKEGTYFLQREIEIPLEVSAKQLGVIAKDPIAGTAEIDIYSQRPPAYEGRFDVRVSGTLAGSATAENAQINVSLTCRNSLDVKDKHLTVGIKPFEDQMTPVTANGKLPDILTVGSAKLAVEKIASDSSEIVLVLLSGNLLQERERGSTLEVGKPFPEFARVEMLNRRFLTLTDLKTEAGADGYIVLIFGDFKKSSPMPGYYDPRAMTKNLSMDESMVVNTLKKDCDNNILIGFVCQQLSLADLYEKWLGRELDFFVLSEFSNPMEMQFIIPAMQPFGGYPRPERGETLREQLGLQNELIITALVNGHGDLVYLNTNAGRGLSGSLVQINKLMKEAPKPPTPSAEK